MKKDGYDVHRGHHEVWTTPRAMRSGPPAIPEFAEFLVKEGIDSISINPDSVMKITLTVLETEKMIGR